MTAIPADIRQRLLLMSWLTVLGNLMQVPFEALLTFLPAALLLAWVGWRWSVSKIMLGTFALGMPAYIIIMFDGDFSDAAKNLLIVGAMVAKGTEIKTTRDGRVYSTVAMMCPFVAILQDQAMSVMVTSGVGMLVAFAMTTMVMLEEGGHRRANWGAIVRPALMAVACAAPVAAAAFVALPRLQGPLWGWAREQIMEQTTGVSEHMEPGNWVDLFNDPSTAMMVDEVQPPFDDPSDVYWRGPVLDHFDGRRWTRSTARMTSVPGPFLPGARMGVSRSYRVFQEPMRVRYTFALDAPLQAPDGVKLGDDLSPFTARFTNDVTVFKWSTPDPHPIPRTLSEEERERLTKMPEGNPRAKEMMAAWKVETPEPMALAQRVHQYFQKELTYSLIAPALGPEVVDDFVFNTKTGFCEHFSSSFTLMMRMAGIPARVVNGYQGGEFNEFGNFWRVRQSDAHAWSEVWVDGRGWIRIDPTAGLREANGGDGSSSSQEVGARYAWSWMRKQWHSLMNSRDDKGKFPTTSVTLKIAGVVMAVVLVLVGLVWGIVAGWRLIRRWWHDKRTPEELAWVRFERRLKRRGLVRQNWESPEVWLERLPPDAEWDGGRDLTRAYLAWRYAEQTSPTLVRLLRQWRAPKGTKNGK